MNTIFNLVQRNLKKYLRNKSTVFFSFLSVFIIIGLYGFFLGDMQVRNIQSVMGDVDGISFMINSWIVAGLLCVSTITIPLTILGFFTDDTDKKIIDDFYATPVKRHQIVLGYVISSWVIGIIMVFFTLLLGEIYIVIKGGELLSLLSFIKVLGVISFSVISFSGFLFAMTIFIKSNAALNMFHTITGTTIGFLAGIYVPVGMLSGTIAVVIKLFPVAQSASIFRKIIMERPLEMIFENAPPSIVSAVRESFGVDLVIGDYFITTENMLLIILLFGVLFYGLSILIISKRKRK